MYNWFDYRDSRNLNAEGRRIERQAEARGQESYSPGKSKNSTSRPAKVATIPSSSAGGPQCKKGKSCKASCIYRGDDCLEGLPPEAAKALNQLVGRIRGFVDTGGDEETALAALERMEEAGAQTAAKKIAKALDAMEDAYPDPKEREEAITQIFDLTLYGIARKGDTGQRQTYDEDEITFLANNKQIDALEKIYQKSSKGELTPEQTNEMLRPLAQARRVNTITEAQLDLAMAMIPKDTMSSLQKQGSPGEWGKWGPNQSSLEPPQNGWTPKNEAGPERARMIVRIGLEENMRDMYTGRRVGFGDIDLEHSIPFTVAKRGAETGSNFGLATRLANRGKSDGSPEDWRQKVLKKYTENGELTDKGRTKLRKEQDDARSYNTARRKAEEETTTENVLSVFAGIDSAGASTNDKEALKNKAMNSIAGYTETFHSGWRANRAGSSRRIYVYRNSSEGSAVLDEAAVVIDRAIKRGDKDRVTQVMNILKDTPTRINQRLDEQFGPDRTDKEVGEVPSQVANQERRRALELIRELG